MTQLCTVEQLKQYVTLGRNVQSDVPLLGTMITACSAAIETYIGRTILSATYTEVRDGTGTGTIVLTNYPIVSVSSVAIGTPPATRIGLTADTDYIVGANAIRSLGKAWPRGVANLSITYVAGFAAVPADIADACAKWTALRYRQLERIGQSSKTLAGETVSFDLSAMPADVKLTLGGYRRVAQGGS